MEVLIHPFPSRPSRGPFKAPEVPSPGILERMARSLPGFQSFGEGKIPQPLKLGKLRNREFSFLLVPLFPNPCRSLGMGIHKEVTAEMKTPQEHLGKISLDHPRKNPKIPTSRSMLLPEVWEMIQAGSSIKIPGALPRDSRFIRKNILYSHLEQRRSQNSPAGAAGNDRSRQSQGFPSGTGISHS